MGYDVLITLTDDGSVAAVQISDHRTNRIIWEASDLDSFDEAVDGARHALLNVLPTCRGSVLELPEVES